MNEKRVSLIPIQPTPRWAYPLVWGISILPWMPLLTIWAFAIRAWIKLGHWPVPLRDDPKFLGLDAWYYACWLGILAYPVGILGAVVLMVLALFALRRRCHHWTKRLWFRYAALHGVLAVFIAQWDILRGNLFYWFFD